MYICILDNAIRFALTRNWLENTTYVYVRSNACLRSQNGNFYSFDNIPVLGLVKGMEVKFSLNKKIKITSLKRGGG